MILRPGLLSTPNQIRPTLSPAAAAYCFYYWYARSDMNGLMQASFYFGYMLMVCYGERGRQLGHE